MLFWALLASGEIAMRKVDGWQTLAAARLKPLTSPPEPEASTTPETPHPNSNTFATPPAGAPAPATHGTGLADRRGKLVDDSRSAGSGKGLRGHGRLYAATERSGRAIVRQPTSTRSMRVPTSHPHATHRPC